MPQHPRQATDIDKIISTVASTRPALRVRRLTVAHPGVDDGGIWFFERIDRNIEVQLESSTGNCPFLIESNLHNRRIDAKTVDEAVGIIEAETDGI